MTQKHLNVDFYFITRWITEVLTRACASHLRSPPKGRGAHNKNIKIVKTCNQNRKDKTVDLDELISALQSFRKQHGNVKEVVAAIRLHLDPPIEGWDLVQLLDQVESVAWIAADDILAVPDRVVMYAHSMTNSEGGVTLAAALGPQVTPRVAQKPPVQSLHDWARLKAGAGAEVGVRENDGDGKGKDGR